MSQAKEMYSNLLDQTINKGSNGKRAVEAREPKTLVATLTAEKATANALSTQLAAEKAKLIKDGRKTKKDLEVSLEKAMKEAHTAMKEVTKEKKALEIRAEEAEARAEKAEKRAEQAEARAEEAEAKRGMKGAQQARQVSEGARLRQDLKDSNALLKIERTAVTKSATLTEQLRKQIADVTMEEKKRGTSAGTLLAQSKDLMTQLEKARNETACASAENEVNIVKHGLSEQQLRKALKKEGRKKEKLEKEISDLQKENGDLQAKLEREIRKSKKEAQKNVDRDESIAESQKEWQQRAQARWQEALNAHTIESVDLRGKHKQTKAELRLAEKELGECKTSEQRSARKLGEAVASAAKHKARAKELQVRLDAESHRKWQENVTGSGSASGKFTSPSAKRVRGSSFGGTPIHMEELGEDEGSVAAVEAKTVWLPTYV
jgi:hypothetical protein